MEILIPFLKKRYKDNQKEIDESAKEIKIKLDTQKDQIFELMEKLTKRPISNEKFQIRYTTCLRAPYNRKT
ncbi:hypothetical protein J5751_01485 [bacterium]|nr:hypothetical protein [bacterium]